MLQLFVKLSYYYLTRRMFMIDFTGSLRDRFIRYTAFDTQSDPEKCGIARPTTPGQEVLQRQLMKELEEFGLEVYYGEEKVVMGRLEGNAEGTVIGFMAHVDTADDVAGNGVKAQLISSYDGCDIILKNGTVIKADEDQDLALYKGREIITSDGTTLLGSDDKAGVAIIMEAIKYLTEHKEVKHGPVEVYFTPDEETGSGMSMFPYSRMKSSVCYTVDGGRADEIESECFNAATVKIRVKGVSIHLGSARGKLVNALTIVSQIVSALPQAESPEATDGRYGYYCPLDMKGSATEAELSVFIRDFDIDSFKHRIECVEKLASAIGAIYRGSVEIDTAVSYHNMAEANKSNPKALESIFESGKKLGFDLYEEIIRGGTDGARLAETGVPCPNLFTGGHNLHSLKEWVSVDAMNKSANLVLGIIDYWRA